MNLSKGDYLLFVYIYVPIYFFFEPNFGEKTSFKRLNTNKYFNYRHNKNVKERLRHTQIIQGSSGSA